MKHLINPTIFKDSPHDPFEHISKNFRRLKWFNFTFVQVEIRLNERKVQIVVNIFLGNRLVVKDYIFLEAQQYCQLGK